MKQIWVLCYQLWDRKTLPTIQLNTSVFIGRKWRIVWHIFISVHTAYTLFFTFVPMKIEAFSRNIGKVFQSLSWYQRTLFSVYAGANWEATTPKLKYYISTAPYLRPSKTRLDPWPSDYTIHWARLLPQETILEVFMRVTSNFWIVY